MYSRICDALAIHGDLTDREIHDKTGMDISTINARRNELIEFGIIKHKGYRKNRNTGKKAMVWGL